VTQSLYRRLIIKLGGESLSNPGGYGIDPARAEVVAARIAAIHAREIEVGVVIGAGNLWRGTDGIDHGMDRARADQIGMIATVMNALALADALERVGVTTRVQTAIEMRAIAEPYIRLRAMRHLEKARVVIFGAGTGNPYFTTDTAAALRAAEIGADLLVKATKVDGVYDKDPQKYPDARRFERLSYLEALNMQLRIMDSTAITLCMDNYIPIVVLNLWDDESLERLVRGESVGTLIGG
jgi:uridylate kinase